MMKLKVEENILQGTDYFYRYFLLCIIFFSIKFNGLFNKASINIEIECNQLIIFILLMIKTLDHVYFAT